MRKVTVNSLLITLIFVGVAAGCQPIQPVIPVQTETQNEEPREETAEGSGAITAEAATARGMAMAEPAETTARCPIFVLTTGELATDNADPLALLMAESQACPTDVFALRDLLIEEGAQLKTAMVANRGFHNPAFGSFSLFEMVEGELASIATVVEKGEFFFGHFTAPAGAVLIADQNPRRGSLMVELIAWDPAKGAFNFYELRGSGTQGVWVYNGDSFAILNDIRLLHQQPNPDAPQFGENLRCSGCHMAGGPIMKELAAPHNDWWTVERGLNFGGRRPDASLTTIVGGNFSALVDASELANGVQNGLDKLQASEAFQTHVNALSLPERLRPLFCPVELNLETDALPLDEGEPVIQIPAAFFVDPRLAQGAVTIDKVHYAAALATWNAAFPEIERADGDRAWETPVKAVSDIRTVQSLVDQGLIDEEFVADVLAVDMTNPALSRERCGLLRLLPEAEAEGWQATFTVALEAASEENPAAAVLHDFLTDPTKNRAFHQTQAQQLLATCQAQLQEEASVAALFGLLAQKRAEVFVSELSQSPGGQILEPGFRVIFPEVTPQPQPWSSKLTATCQVAVMNGP